MGNPKKGVGTALHNTDVVSNDLSNKVEKRTTSPLLSPMALMALGLTGAATTSVLSREVSPGGRLPHTNADTLVSDFSAQATVLDSAPLGVAEANPIVQQMDMLIQRMLVETVALAPEALVTDSGRWTLAESVDGGAETVIADSGADVILAQATIEASAGANTVSAVTTAGGSAAVAGGVSAGAILAGVAGLALIGGASKGSSASSAAPPAPGDTTAPVIQSLTANSVSKTITLTYDSPLATTHLPAANAFAVVTGGVANAVASVAVNGNVLTLTLTNAFAAGAVTVTYTDPTAGNDVSAIQDLAGNDASGFVQGIVADGYIRGAQIYIDTNKNGIADLAEKLNGVVTDANGNFLIPFTAPAGTIIAVGGINIDTGIANTVPLKAPQGSTTINPLTTLVQALIDAAPPGTPLTAQAAAAKVASALGLTLPSGASLTSYDPLSATDGGALAAQKAAAQVATVLALAFSAPASGTSSSAAVQTVVGNFVTQINTAASGSPIDLSNADTVTALFNNSLGVSVASSAAVADAQDALADISDAADLGEVSDVQSSFLDAIAPAAPTMNLTAGSDTGASTTDRLTNDTTPTLRVTLQVAALDGTAVVAGDTLTVTKDGNNVGSAIISAVDVVNGYVDITLSALLLEGAHSLTAAVTDKGTNTSAVSSALTFTLDTAAAAPTVALSTDTGGSNSDKITSNGALIVSGAESGATVQYSTDSGSNWASSFTAATGVNSVQVRQTDVAGNVSNASTAYTFTLDTAAAAPTVALSTDTGSSNSDKITSNGTLTVSGNETNALVEYSTNGGTVWASSFTAATGANSVQVRQTDVAGNVSNASTAYTFTLDTTAAAPTVALSTDTGSSITDKITSNGALSVSGAESGATVQYSTDGGTVWASSFTAAAGANSVQVRQTDVAGNISVASSALAFTLDAGLPTISASSPADGGLTLGLAANLVLAASESIAKGAGTVSIFKGDNTLIEAISVSGNQITITGTGANTQISINPTTDLVKDQTYYVKVSAGAFTDIAGNAWAGINDATSWNFTGAGASVVISAVASDNTVNLAESGQAITVSGTLGAEASILQAYTTSNMTAVLRPASGSDITLTNLSYSYSGGTTGTWSAVIPQSVLSGVTDYTLTVTFTGNAGAAANIVGVGTQAVHIDTVVASPTVALSTDTGSSNTDKITSNGVLSVSGAESGALVDYTTNGGIVWTNSFTAVTGANSVQMRQTDVAGNVSSASTAYTFTLDATAPAAPTVALSTDTGNSTDKITSNGALTVSGAESGALVDYTTNGGIIWTNSFTAVTGANSVQVRQTDVAGNVSDASAAYTFTLDTTAAAPTVALSTDTGISNSDKITSNGALIVSGAESGATVQYSTDSGSNWISSFTAATGANSVQVRQTDVAGNVSGASTAYTFTLDTTSPTVQIVGATNPNPSTGAVTIGFNFNEAVTGFDADDVTLVNGTKGSFTATDSSRYTLVVTPASSAAPQSMTLNVAAGAATDTAGNASAAAAQWLASILYGTSGVDTLTVGTALDYIFLGAGNDIIKLTSAAGSTTTATDVVLDFGAGDKIDLSSVLGAGGSGYTGSALGDTGFGFVELKNVTLTQNANNTTTVQFNIHFDTSTINGSKITGAVVDLAYNYSSVTNSQLTIPTFSYDDGFGGTATAPIWSNFQSNLSGSSANGRIAVTADLTSSNPIVDANSNVLQVRLLMSGAVSSFGVALESGTNGSATYVTTANGVTHNVDVGIAKIAGITVGTTGTLEIITDTGTLGTVGDNQLHMVSTYDATSNLTRLQVKYDTNASFGSTTASNVIAMDFLGDVTANLTPAHLTFI